VTSTSISLLPQYNQYKLFCGKKLTDSCYFLDSTPMNFVFCKGLTSRIAPHYNTLKKIIAEAGFEAIQTSGLPKAMVQLLYHFHPEDGLKL